MKLRTEGPVKLRGEARYIDDMHFPDLLYGATVRATVARGEIKSVIFDHHFDWSDITIVTAKDIPGKNHVAMIHDDWPFLAEFQINHWGEAVVLLACADREKLIKAQLAVKIIIEPMPSIHSLEDSLAKKEIIWGNDNVFKTYTIKKGDVASAWSQADLIVEAQYHTGAQEQLYIEPNGMVALANDRDGVTVWGSLQCPYYIHKALMPLFNLPADKVRVVQAETGGGFGGKEEFPSLLAGHAALLALKSGKHVKMIYDRAEDMANTTKRHPSRSRHKMGVSKEGKIVAWEIDFALDGGAYLTLSPVVLSRGTIHAAGPYFCENILVNSTAVATNTFPHGAFRGFGAPQSIFATERFMDHVAYQLKMDPLEFRRRNFIKTGQTTATGQLITEKVDYNGLLDSVLEKIDYHRRRKLFQTQNTHSHIKRGLGIASFMHGAGFTGSGETYLASKVAVEVNNKGMVRILASSVEMGQGQRTIFTTIAQEALKISSDMIEIVTPDTALVPDSGPTVASRTCMVVGKLVESACVGLLQTLRDSGLPENYDEKDFFRCSQLFIKEHGALKCNVQYQQPPNVFWDDKNYQGSAYATYAWAIYAAQVAVDTLTYESKVEDFVAIQEIGKVLNATMAAGQIEGGIAQAIGYAIFEKVIYKQGQMINNQMTNYIMPTASDLPIIRVFFREDNKDYGPGGAKGIGELPMDGPAPAILNAIEDATGISAKTIPLMPEDLMLLMEASR
jgi:CO/xanthine dehydrogenase Mo-binding subunit